jgi:hypothetical protein
MTTRKTNPFRVGDKVDSDRTVVGVYRDYVWVVGDAHDRPYEEHFSCVYFVDEKGCSCFDRPDLTIPND